MKIAKTLWKTKIFYFRTPRRIHKAIIKYFVSDYIEIDGFKIYTGENDDDNFTIYGFEQHKDLIMLIQKYVKKGDTVFDIGANVGKVSLILARQVGDAGKVYSFEPEQNNFELLKKNIEINNLKNVTPLKYAVTDKNEKTLLKVSGACTTHQVCNDTNDATQEIETISLDEYFKDQKIDFMKIDAEGSEPKIINGMKNIVKNNPHLKFITEYEVRVMTALKVDRVKYTDDLISLGYDIFETRDGVKELIPTDSTKLLNHYNKNSPYRTNLFCIKPSDLIP